MNIEEAKNEIIHTLSAYLKKDGSGAYLYPLVRQRPILLIGPPGIGKTAIMEQIAAECKVGLVAYTITHHTRQSAVGLPKIVTRNYGETSFDITEYTMSEIIASVYECMERTGKKEGILFIDEINCVSETLAPAMLQFLQNKTFGTHKVPAGWIIVAAGNPPAYNKSVREFDMVTLDRVRKISIQAEPDVWLEYARKQNVHGAILSYLSLKKENFYRVENIADGKFFVTARGWEDLSQLLKSYEELQVQISEELIGEFLQMEEIARDFAGYYRLYEKYKSDYQIPDILSGRIAREAYENCCAMAKSASFEERFIVTEMVLDLEHPLDNVCYEELKPLLTRVDQQNLQIACQLEELKKTEAVRREFSANVSHELKTPLMSISGYAELMMNGMVRPENIADFSGRIYKEANRLGNLVADIIQLSRLDEQQDEVVSMESVELNELAEDVVNNLQNQAQKKNISLRYYGHPVTIQGVRHVLYEMLYNIADNAVRYTNPGGHIYIYVGKNREEKAYYRVEDDGIGIPKSEQKRIFERFYRVDKSHSRQTGGTGLGLSIVKHGATLHHAQIHVDSDLGKGTKMELRF